MFFSCNRSDGDKDEMFTILSKKDTGIDFNNRLEESTYLNGLVYEYYYNGAGVAVADFNNDDLLDIYFVSNRRANKLFINQGDLKFKDVTKDANATGGFGFPGGVTVVDINNDGLMDIYICKSGRIDNPEHLENELLVNTGFDENGIPHFIEAAKEYRLNLPYYSTQASFFDYDLDGDLDMFLINHGIDIYKDDLIPHLMGQQSPRIGERLFQNVNGKYFDVTDAAGIVNNKLGFTLGVSIGDLNNDQWPDIYTGNDYSEKDHLYINNKDGTFRETSLESFGHISNFSMGNDIADINNDGWLDLISLDMMSQDNYSQKTSMSGMSTKRFESLVDKGLHHQYMFNALQLNNGTYAENSAPLFSEIAQLAEVHSTDWSWSPLFFDFDNDQYNDLFVSNGVKRDFRNNDFSIYRKEKQIEALDKGTLNKEGYINDLLEKMPSRKQKNVFMLNNKDLTFKNLEFDQPETSSNGAAYGDFDNDGDIDIVVNNSDDGAFIYRNNTDRSNNYIKIKLKGLAQNINAIGARVEVKTKNNLQIAEQFFSRGFQSAMATGLHFGLGQTKLIDTLFVKWPNGKVQYETNIKANQTIVIAYSHNRLVVDNKKRPSFLFQNWTEKVNLNHRHKENKYDDFQKEPLIPHKMSKMGPALAIADVNNDGLDDFYIGGAKGRPGELFLQRPNGVFVKDTQVIFGNHKEHEDTGAHFFDADNDGDQDLYVVSGGNEEKPHSTYYRDRFYINNGKGKFEYSENGIPKITTSGAAITSGDFDNDGDLDLFIGSRVRPMNYGKYSKSYILENQSTVKEVKFIDRTKELLPELMNYTMVTDAVWVDYDNDSLLDLVVANEWGAVDFFKNKKNGFVKKSKELGTEQHKGWWYSLEAVDVDNDGDMDIVAGNLGLNYKYKASEEEPFYMYINDFDKNDSDDIVLAYHQDSLVYPLRGRECSSNQMPFIKKKFQTYDAFAKAELRDVYGAELDKAIRYSVSNFASGIFRNMGKNGFEFIPFENQAQISSVNEILASDFDGDGKKDLLFLGNLYASEVETPRNDASYGHFLKGNAGGEFVTVPSKISGLYVKGDVKKACMINLGDKNSGHQGILIAKNDDYLMLIKIKAVKKK